jgi:hypothetical protein
MKPEAKFQLHYNKEELHFKPNQVAVIKVIVEIRDESITEYLSFQAVK